MRREFTYFNFNVIVITFVICCCLVVSVWSSTEIRGSEGPRTSNAVGSPTVSREREVVDFFSLPSAHSDRQRNSGERRINKYRRPSTQPKAIIFHLKDPRSENGYRPNASRDQVRPRIKTKPIDNEKSKENISRITKRPKAIAYSLIRLSVPLLDIENKNTDYSEPNHQRNDTEKENPVADKSFLLPLNTTENSSNGSWNNVNSTSMEGSNLPLSYFVIKTNGTSLDKESYIIKSSHTAIIDSNPVTKNSTNETDSTSLGLNEETSVENPIYGDEESFNHYVNISESLPKFNSGTNFSFDSKLPASNNAEKGYSEFSHKGTFPNGLGNSFGTFPHIFNTDFTPTTLSGQLAGLDLNIGSKLHENAAITNSNPLLDGLGINYLSLLGDLAGIGTNKETSQPFGSLLPSSESTSTNAFSALLPPIVGLNVGENLFRNKGTSASSIPINEDSSKISILDVTQRDDPSYITDSSLSTGSGKDLPPSFNANLEAILGSKNPFEELLGSPRFQNNPFLSSITNKRISESSSIPTGLEANVKPVHDYFSNLNPKFEPKEISVKKDTNGDSHV